ncbi:MAG: hypothetical protein N3A66_09995, partial [Planctomycetota bacterium]|nr:hypothetical protein [Planctomycetota bacterium]
MAKLSATVNYFRQALPLAKALRASLEAVGIAPVFECDSPYVAASRQAWGDIEYIFAVNIATDPERGRKNDLAPLVATIALPDDGRPIYDAVLGAAAAEFKKEGQALKATLRFGPGQMRVFCRPARPIGKVQALAPTLLRDFSLPREPIRVEIGAALLDKEGQIIAGAAPLHICVYDPLGSLRYELYRATDMGIFKMFLPLAANDPAGEWRVNVRELLSGTESATTFVYQPALFCAAVAGAARRAVCFGNERENIYRFFRLHREVTIVKGKSDYCQAAAERLQTILKPWFVECKIVEADEAAKPRDIPPEATATWCGLGGLIRKPEDVRLHTAGSAVRGQAIVIGNPEDNALLKHIADNRFLPFAPVPGIFPGVGRGYLAWQLDAIGAGQESVTLIAHDAEGLAEAVGTLYEIAAGLEPLMAAEPPKA